MADRHAYFLGDSFQSNVAAIDARVTGPWMVICDHCGVALAGTVDGTGAPPRRILWSHRGDSWFGTFTEMR